MATLPPADSEYLASKGLNYEVIEDGGTVGLIIRGYVLPEGKYDAATADILILLPSGYPDIAPDMFHLLPWVKLVNGNKYPIKADRPVTFIGQSWQRWSRHNKEWRAGTDGIWTMLKRVEAALEVAK